MRYNILTKNKGEHPEGVKKEADFSFEACYKEVEFEVEVLHSNIFTEYGKSLVRAKQDIFFNKTMIRAYEKYIENNNIRWDDY